jgi:hypothetical protein
VVVRESETVVWSTNLEKYRSPNIYVCCSDGLAIVICLAHFSYQRGFSARRCCAVTEKGKVLWLCRDAIRDAADAEVGIGPRTPQTSVSRLEWRTSFGGREVCTIAFVVEGQSPLTNCI